MLRAGNKIARAHLNNGRGVKCRQMAAAVCHSQVGAISHRSKQQRTKQSLQDGRRVSKSNTSLRLTSDSTASTMAGRAPSGGNTRKRGHQHHPRNNNDRRLHHAASTTNRNHNNRTTNIEVQPSKSKSKGDSVVCDNSTNQIVQVPLNVVTVSDINRNNTVAVTPDNTINRQDDNDEVKSNTSASSGSKKKRKPSKTRSQSTNRSTNNNYKDIPRPAAEGSSQSDAENEDPELEELARLRCTSERTEVVAERELRRRNRRCADYPGLAFGSSIFSSDTMMKFSIIRNELHNIMNTQLKRVCNVNNAAMTNKFNKHGGRLNLTLFIFSCFRSSAVSILLSRDVITIS